LRLVFSRNAWAHYRDWADTDRAMLDRINDLIDAMMRDPFGGTGKPEPLRGQLASYWSRRITREHRIVYRCVGKPGDQQIEIVQCRYHY